MNTSIVVVTMNYRLGILGTSRRTTSDAKLSIYIISIFNFFFQVLKYRHSIFRYIDISLVDILIEISTFYFFLNIDISFFLNIDISFVDKLYRNIDVSFFDISKLYQLPCMSLRISTQLYIFG